MKGFDAAQRAYDNMTDGYDPYQRCEECGMLECICTGHCMECEAETQKWILEENSGVCTGCK